ncbi:hypothetical protein QQ045_024972 [Rhodiola kirilowii]
MFEPMWLKHKEYGERIRDIWGELTCRNMSLSERLSSSATSLKVWGKECFRNVNKRISYLKNNLQWIQQYERTCEATEAEANIVRELDDWLYKEELYWKQRSRADWLKEGDRNTRFFHLRASQRRIINCIQKLQGSTGEWITDEDGVSREIVHYFRTNIYRSSRRRSHDRMDQDISFIPSCLTDGMAENLNAPFTELEIQRHYSRCIQQKPLVQMDFQLFSSKKVGHYLRRRSLVALFLC